MCLFCSVLHLMEGNKKNEKGGPEKARMKKKRTLEESASKWSKTTDLFRNNQASARDAGELTGHIVSNYRKI